MRWMKMTWRALCACPCEQAAREREKTSKQVMRDEERLLSGKHKMRQVGRRRRKLKPVLTPPRFSA